MDSAIKISPPVYLVGKKICCWRCGARMSAVAIVAKIAMEDEDPEAGILTEITELPATMRKFLERKVPTFRKVYSKTTEISYYGNTCPRCGVLSGDFFLHCEPGAPFFPTDESEAKELYLTEFPLDGEVSVEAYVGFGSGELILEHAKVI